MNNIHLKRSKIIFIRFLIFFLIIMPFFIAINFHNEAGISNQRDPNIIILKMSYFNNTCDPIFIDGIAGGIGAHNWTWAQNQPWCTYIASNEIYYIENLTINGGSTNSCIEIRNSNVNLIIRNCTLYNSTNSPNDAGLNLINVSNSQIIENNCTNNPYHGIRIYNSSDNRIYLNSLNDNYVRGLIISGSNNTEISNNTFINTPYPRDSVYGIDCTGNCFNLTISNNTIIGNQLEGIIINKLSNSTISNNKINNNGQRGISFSGDSIGNTIKNNKIYENAHEGIFLNTLSSNNNFTENEIYENGRDGMVLNSMSTLNNILDNEIYENGGYGLSLDFYCNDNKIIGNKINNNDDHGIILSDNSGNIIIRNEANDNAEFGIKLENSNNSIIFNNTASYVGLGNQQQSGIVVGQNSNNNTILHNTVASNFWQGIYLQNANFNNITANMLNNNSNDIVIYSSNNTIVIGNSVNARNFDIYETNSKDNIIIWNSIKGNLADSIIIDTYGEGNFTWSQAIEKLAWCSGSGSVSDPYIFENITINGQNASSCIEIRNSDVYFTLRNCNFYNSSNGMYDAGIKLYNVNNSKLIDNDCSGNKRNGMVLIESINNTISRNDMYFNIYNGICLYNCSINTISENTVNYNGYSGISLMNSNNNTIFNNHESFNNNGFSGILLLYSHGNNISSNLARYNEYGIYLNHSNFNYGSGNDLTGNTVRAFFQSEDCVGNNIKYSIVDEGNPDDGGDFLLLLIIIMLIIGISAAAVFGGLFVILKIKHYEGELPSDGSTKKEKFRIPSTEIGKIQPKKVKTQEKREISPALSEEEKKAIRETESEVNIEKTSYICVVHKGIIVGRVYICPECHTFYCEQCVNALKKRGENCWSCNRKFD